MSTDLKLQRLHSEIKISLKIDKAVSFYCVMQVTDESGQFFATFPPAVFVFAWLGSGRPRGSFFFSFASPEIIYSFGGKSCRNEMSSFLKINVRAKQAWLFP